VCMAVAKPRLASADPECALYEMWVCVPTTVCTHIEDADSWCRVNLYANGMPEWCEACAEGCGDDCGGPATKWTHCQGVTDAEECGANR
jgi:hypothetical protein